MTKKQSLYYLGAVVALTILGFIYTTVVIVPDKNEVPPLAVAEDVSAQAEPEPEVPLGQNDLPNTSWRWLWTENATGTTISQPLQDKPFILSFADADSMSSQTDCNNITGSYTQGDTALTFGPLMSTKMFCEGSQETDYMAQLQQVNKHTISNNMLLLSMSEGAGMMFFVKVTE